MKMGFRCFNAIILRKFHKSSTRSIQSSLTHTKLFRPLIPQLQDHLSSAYPENPSFKISKRSHGGHSHHHHHQDQTSKEGDKIFRLGLAADIGLTTGKVFTGYLSGSTAIIADAAHSLSDVGLLNAVVQHWEKAERRNCARHIYANWHKKYKGDDLKLILRKAVMAYCESDFLVALEEMKEENADATNAFLNQNPKCFCRAFMDTTTSADVVVNNMAETFNGYIIQSRSKHLINMLEDIRVAIMSRLCKMQMHMAGKDVKVCPMIQQKLDKEKNRAYKCSIFPSSRTSYQVRAYDEVSVDMSEWSCTCRKWDLTGIPCYHACAVIGFFGKYVEDYVQNWYQKEMYMKAYDFNIPPLPSEKFWSKVVYQLDPPPIRAQPGRPKKNRRKDPHELPKKKGRLSKHGCSVTCGNCKGKGHNKRKCPLPAKAPTTTENAPKRSKGRPRKQQETMGTQESQVTMNTQ